MPSRAFTEYRAAVTQLFVEADPWELIAIGAPDDEYEFEISALLEWGTPVTKADLRRVLGDIAEATAESLEAGIAEIRRHYGYGR